jgi:hypothetical protein
VVQQIGQGITTKVKKVKTRSNKAKAAKATAKAAAKKVGLFC